MSNKLLEEGRRLSRYKVLWIVSTILLLIYIIREIIVQKRIKQYNGKKLFPYNVNILIIRYSVVAIFYVFSWLQIASSLSIILLIGIILQYVLPKPSFELIYKISGGVICKAKLIKYKEIEELRLDGSIIYVRFKNMEKEKTFELINTNKANVLYSHLYENTL